MPKLQPSSRYVTLYYECPGCDYTLEVTPAEVSILGKRVCPVCEYVLEFDDIPDFTPKENREKQNTTNNFDETTIESIVEKLVAFGWKTKEAKKMVMEEIRGGGSTVEEIIKGVFSRKG